MWFFEKGTSEQTTSPSKVYHSNAKYNAKYSDRMTTPLWVPLSAATTSTTCTATSPVSTKPCSCQSSRNDLLQRASVQTRYMDMLLGLDDIPRLYNVYASLFTWLLLAGYVVFPATFTTLNQSNKITAIADNGTKFERDLLNGVRNAPLLYIAAVCCTVGGSGMLWLWCKWRHNYVWMINRIFLPGLLNSIAGLISTLVNVYTAQDGDYSVTARATLGVTGVFSAVTALLFLLYNNWALSRVKSRHEREVGQGSLGERHGGVKLKVKIGAYHPDLVPGAMA